MPRYDYHCLECSWITTHAVAYERRQDVQACEKCGGRATYQYPVGAIRGYIAFEAHYDEALGCDIHSAGEKRRILKDKGLIEAGDPVHGAREFDKHAPEHIGQKPLQGVPYTSFRPRTPLRLGIEEGGKTHWLRESEVKTL